MNIGDKVIHYVTGEEFTICDISISNVWLRKDTGHIDCTDRQFVYQCWYEAEKKRADEAEAKWDELKKKTTDKYKYLERQFEAWEHDENESKLWNASKHEVLMILKDMSDIERGDTQ